MDVKEQDTINMYASTTPVSTQKMYSFRYNWLGRDLEEYIWINCILESGSTGYINAIIKKYYGYVWDWTNMRVTSNYTSVEIIDTSIKLGITSGKITNLFCGGTYSEGGSITASIGYSNSTPIPGVSISYGFTLLKTTDYYPVYVNASSASTKVVGGKFLLNDGDNMNVMAYYANGAGTVCARYEYRLFNSGFNQSLYGDVSLENSYR